MIAVTTKLVEVFHDPDHYIHTHSLVAQMHVTSKVFNIIYILKC